MTGPGEETGQEVLRESQGTLCERVHVAGRMNLPHCSPAGVGVPHPPWGQQEEQGRGPEEGRALEALSYFEDLPEQGSTEGSRTLFTSTSGVPPGSHPAILEDGDAARR